MGVCRLKPLPSQKMGPSVTMGHAALHTTWCAGLRHPFVPRPLGVFLFIVYFALQLPSCIHTSRRAFPFASPSHCECFRSCALCPSLLCAYLSRSG